MFQIKRDKKWHWDDAYVVPGEERARPRLNERPITGGSSADYSVSPRRPWQGTRQMGDLAPVTLPPGFSTPDAFKAWLDDRAPTCDTSGMDIHEAVERTTPETNATWYARSLVALRGLGLACPMDRTRLALILLAAGGPTWDHIPPGQIRALALGDNAIITLDRKLKSKYIQDGRDYGELEVCTVDELCRGLEWLLKQINGTDADYKAMTQKINSWISRDESNMGLHVERMREAMNADGTAKI